MRSFTRALFVAALATFTYAVPLNLPSGPDALPLPGGLDLSSLGQLGDVGAGSLLARDSIVDQMKDHLRNAIHDIHKRNIIPSVGQVEDKAKSVEGSLVVRESFVDQMKDHLRNALHGIQKRDAKVSVEVIFNELITASLPLIDEFIYIDSSNATVAVIANVAASIEADIQVAISGLQALFGAELNVILGDLTVAQLGALIGTDIELIFAAAGDVLVVVQAEGGDIASETQDILVGLGTSVTQLVNTVIALVEGITAPIAAELVPVNNVIVELGLTGLVTTLDASH